MKKTIGGDRLGSGNKMQADLSSYNRSTHDLGKVRKTTMSAGTLVPIYTALALPGDTWDINLNCDIKTHPTIGPLFGSYKVQIDVFEAPIRLYQAQLHNNAINIGMRMNQVYLPQFNMTIPAFDAENPTPIDRDNSQINPSCLLSHLDLRGIGTNNSGIAVVRQLCALKLLMYWDTYKNYYANKQEEIGAVLHTPTPALQTTVDELNVTMRDGTTGTVPGPTGTSIGYLLEQTIQAEYTIAPPIPSQIMLNTSIGRYSMEELCSGVIFPNVPLVGLFDYNKYGTITVYSWDYIKDNEINQKPPEIATFPLENIDKMRNKILAFAEEVTPFIVSDTGLTPYIWPIGHNADGYNYALNNQEGLALKTYQSDLFNNWIQTDWIDGPNGVAALSAIDVVDDVITIDQINLSRKIYDMMNRIAISGGSYKDYLDVQYQETSHWICESPIYHGGLIKELVFQEVVSNSASVSDDRAQPLGTLAGKGILAKKHKGGQLSIKVKEPGYIMIIASLTPRLDYSQGNKWDNTLRTIADLHVPALDEIGFQDLITEQMAWWDTKWNASAGLWETKSAGKQPAWINYMTEVNETRGNFAIETNEMFMTLNRRYEYGNEVETSIADLTTYIDPAKFNNIFAQTSRDSQNFWGQFAIDAEVRRIISARMIPNL